MESQYHGLSRKKIAELRRKAEKKEKNRAYYEKNREKLIEKTKEKRRQSRESDSRPQTRGSFTIKKAQKGSKAKEIREKRRAAEEERREKIREQTRERVRRHREKAKEQFRDNRRITWISNQNLKKTRN